MGRGLSSQGWGYKYPSTSRRMTEIQICVEEEQKKQEDGRKRGEWQCEGWREMMRREAAQRRLEWTGGMWKWRKELFWQGCCYHGDRPKSGLSSSGASWLCGLVQIFKTKRCWLAETGDGQRSSIFSSHFILLFSNPTLVQKVNYEPEMNEQVKNNSGFFHCKVTV